MAKKNAKNAALNAARKKQNNRRMEIATTLFLLCAVAEFYLLRIRVMVNGTIRDQVAMAAFLPAALYGGLALALCGGALWLLRRKAPKISPALCRWLIGVGAFFAISSAVTLLLFPQGAGILCVAVPVAMILGVVAMLYPLDFFLELLSLTSALIVCALRGKFVSAVGNTAGLAVGAAAMLLLAVLAWLVLRAQKERGVFRVFGHAFGVLTGGVNRVLLFAAIALAFLAAFAALVAASVSFALIWVLAVAAFLLAVYHTVKIL